MAKQPHLSFDFANFDAKGLKPIVSALGRSKVAVLKDEKGTPKIEATNRSRRVKGLPVKTATFYLVDGQSITISATSEGSVYQVRLNKLIVPITNTGNLSAAVKEVAKMVRANSVKFTEKLAKQAIKKHTPIPEKKRGSNSIPARFKASKARIEELNESISERQTAIEQANVKHSEVVSSISTLQDSISDEKSRNERLHRELRELKAA